MVSKREIKCLINKIIKTETKYILQLENTFNSGYYTESSDKITVNINDAKLFNTKQGANLLAETYLDLKSIKYTILEVEIDYVIKIKT